MGQADRTYYIIKALQLYTQRVSYGGIERILGVSHVSVINWVQKYRIKAPEPYNYLPTYEILNHNELLEHLAKPIVPKLLKTCAGKIMCRILRKIIEEEVSMLDDTTTLLDPGVVDAIIESLKSVQQKIIR